jgi:GNAT superfamily N-acetyltransferase
MNNLEIKHNELTAEEFIYLWESVWGNAPTKEQIELALTHSIYVVSVYDRGKVAAMARMIGDMGLCYYIKDVVVHPDYQKNGIGRLLINELLDFIKSNGISGTQIFVELCAMPDKIPFYEKFGFSANEAQRLRIMLPVE